ncbi:hypothetical protein LEP1GSC103_3146 [Leptospira borgpetersenii serovar Javanica str. UI 09931]|uniref:Uncharacterized protein n=3 Tax=Leptospira borgpetersenii TaxID=174 RepID=M3H3S4_LEPBO|nr:hypothetical protein LEP1GSC128_2936 [Leptospira borgpetersenii str. 200801926]EKQ91993.1 hypothetical protein LEP1GSC101_3481 [Leptospira borgpetersenii str. UI 09149]EKR01868.1 hypothetical protein LEP1GSC121_3873 [Leptospira borgpetersenii serovar Castellonis str. 200801910]EMG01744.1 hypothetical protein LEP1GSC123_4248 [Leptospira borgpetersenii str. 200701203]EMK14596.1 hypothetical protein LEP1GSC066_3456 [Leptospira sp. serovar Kenya str. Sh9]EMN11825.1 hypothetical protein LEP1GSC0
MFWHGTVVLKKKMKSCKELSSFFLCRKKTSNPFVDNFTFVRLSLFPFS